jgi:hypothetical protein
VRLDRVRPKIPKPNVQSPNVKHLSLGFGIRWDLGFGNW